MQLKTLPAIARECGVSVRQASYAAEMSKITETGRIGVVRVYDAVAAEQIRYALVRTGALARNAVVVK
jgi:hypothetical protein